MSDISTYDELKSEIQEFLVDDNLGTSLETFIRLAEERHRNELRLRAMEWRQLATMNGTRYLPFPERYLQMRRLRIYGSNEDIVQLAAPSQLLEYWDTASGLPRYFAVTHQLEFNRPGTTELEMQFYRYFEPLTTANQTNWLILNAPSLYLYGSLIHAATFLRDAERIPEFKSQYQDSMQALRTSDKAGQRVSGPLRSRISGPTP